MTDKLPRILRWILFIPIAMVGGALVALIEFWVFDRYAFGWIGDMITAIFSGVLSGIATIYIAVYIAPCCVKRVTVGFLLLASVAIAFKIPLLSDESIGYIVFVVSQDIGIFLMGWFIYTGQVEFSNKSPP